MVKQSNRQERQRKKQLQQIADALLYQIGRSDMNTAKTAQLIKSYEIIDRILQGQGKTGAEAPVVIIDDIPR